jgi:hypothetical protein
MQWQRTSKAQSVAAPLRLRWSLLVVEEVVLQPDGPSEVAAVAGLPAVEQTPRRAKLQWERERERERELALVPVVELDVMEWSPPKEVAAAAPSRFRVEALPLLRGADSGIHRSRRNAPRL